MKRVSELEYKLILANARNVCLKRDVDYYMEELEKWRKGEYRRREDLEDIIIEPPAD